MLLVDGMGWLRLGVNSSLVRYFSCLNAPLFISHFLQTCYKSQLRTGKTDLHSKNQNFTKQTQDCTVKIYKHIFLYVIGNLHFESIKRGRRRGVVECLDNNTTNGDVEEENLNLILANEINIVYRLGSLSL